MPTPLQTVITLPLYGHSYTYIDLSIQRNGKNEKAAAERKQIPPHRGKNLTFKLNSVTESVHPQISFQQHLKNAV